MNGLLTSRAEIELFGKKYEKEDIVPVDFEQDEFVSFKLNKNSSIYKMINKSKVFAISIPIFDFTKQADICDMHEGMFEEKFKLSGLYKIECRTIDCPSVDRSDVFECTLLEEESAKDDVIIYGKVLISRKY